MTTRANIASSLFCAAAFALSGCTTQQASIQPPPVVATLPPQPAVPPVMPAGGYIGMKRPTKRADGRYFTPNLDNTDQAAVWHLRNALNVAALGCDQAGGGVLAPYNEWLQTHAAVIDRYYQALLREWQAAGWWDWQRVYDDNQTRIYNFYAQPAIRTAFCAAARKEVVQVGQVADDDLPTFARAALLRLDRPFVDFFAAYDAWRNYYDPAPPPLVRTVELPATEPSLTATTTQVDGTSATLEPPAPSKPAVGTAPVSAAVEPQP